MRGVIGVAVIAIVASLVAISVPRPSSDEDHVPGAATASPTTAAVLETSPPATTATAAPSRSPIETAAGIPTVPVESSRAMSEEERSDWFWTEVSDFGAYGQTYSSLADITRAAHLVVRGRLIDVIEGDVWPFGDDLPAEFAKPYPEMFGIVVVDQGLKGEPIMRTPGTIEVAGLGAPGMTAADLPKGEFIIFLMNHALQREEGGRPRSPDENDRFHYERPNGYQCVLRLKDGVIDIIDGPTGWEENIGPYPSGLDGLTVESIFERIFDRG